MSKRKMWIVLAVTILLVLLLNIGAVNASHRNDILGMVFIDANLNGIWDVGEEGYGGEYMWLEDEDVFRYKGATLTVTTPAYDEYTVESAGFVELAKGQEINCTRQDLVDFDGDYNADANRPCTGAWGWPVSAKDVYMQVELTVPEGYFVTTANPQFCYTGEEEYMDFGIAPLAAGGGGGAPAVAAAAPAAVSAPAPFQMEVKGTGFVPGLVFVDSNKDGVWQPGEAGYDGEWMWVKADKEFQYVGATITLISPAYDEYELTSAGFAEAEEAGDMVCTPQDYFADGKVNPNPQRPCSGTWALPMAGHNIRYEVWVTAPAGYYLTSPNPQFYTTGSGAMPLDFGIAPLK